MNKLLIGLVILICVYIVGWHQLYGQFIHESYKKYQWYLIFLSVPCTYFSIIAARLISEYFNGKMDDIRIWTTTRTQAQIAGNMNNCLIGNESGLKNYFKFSFRSPNQFELVSSVQPNTFCFCRSISPHGRHNPRQC